MVPSTASIFTTEARRKREGEGNATAAAHAGSESILLRQDYGGQGVLSSEKNDNTVRRFFCGAPEGVQNAHERVQTESQHLTHLNKEQIRPERRGSSIFQENMHTIMCTFRLAQSLCKAEKVVITVL